MRRKLSYWALALLVPLSLASCSQEDTPSLPMLMEMPFYMELSLWVEV